MINEEQYELRELLDDAGDCVGYHLTDQYGREAVLLNNEVEALREVAGGKRAPLALLMVRWLLDQRFAIEGAS